MSRVAFGVAVLTIALAGGRAAAQPPTWVGGLPPVGDIYGYSPLVHSVDPFPTRTSGYAHSMLQPRVGGKRIYPVLPPIQKCPVVVHPALVVAASENPVGPTSSVEPTVPVGPVVRPLPPCGCRRFNR